MLNRQSRLQNLYTSKDENLPDTEEYQKRLMMLALRKKVYDLIEKSITDGNQPLQHNMIKSDRWTKVSAATHIIKQYIGDDAELLDSYGNAEDTRSLLSSFSASIFNEIKQEITATNLDRFLHDHCHAKGATKIEKNRSSPFLQKIKNNDLIQQKYSGDGTVDNDIDTIIAHYAGTYCITIKEQIGGLRENYKSSLKYNQVPISYLLRDERILEIVYQIENMNCPPFPKSKVRFIQHDLLDHAHAFYSIRNLIREAHGPTNGKHKKFFKSIGHPFVHTIMGRESELIAAISFACRQYYWCRQFSKESLCSINSQSLAEEYNLCLESLDADLHSHVICNCILEAEELQAQRGMSYSFDSEGKVSGRFDPWSPEYIEFISDVVNLLHQDIYSASRAPFNLAIIAEDYIHNFHEDLTRDLSLYLKCYSLHGEHKEFEVISSEVREYITMSCHFSAAPPKSALKI